jgi:hypothetical protein
MVGGPRCVQLLAGLGYGLLAVLVADRLNVVTFILHAWLVPKESKRKELTYNVTLNGLVSLRSAWIVRHSLEILPKVLPTESPVFWPGT